MKLILIALFLSIFLVVGSYASGRDHKSNIETGLATQEEIGVDEVMTVGRFKRRGGGKGRKKRSHKN
uniref:Uncharacterized protein n=1 Tax=Ditylenchus dipsaci TaxID=166011 RepID=A0A915DX77_9BILA